MFEKLREASRNDAPANRGSDSPGCSLRNGTCKDARIHFLEFPNVLEASRRFSKLLGGSRSFSQAAGADIAYVIR